uniref:Uncharacterized protein n=1 Tax=Octopus bimaculoides TaxID=37653 RepID=A0A0L8H1U7_OCTBM
MFSMVHIVCILVCIILIQLSICYKLVLKSSSEKLPTDQFQNFQVKYHQKRSLSVIKSSSSEKQTPYRTLLQHPRVIKACEGFRAARSQKYKGKFYFL